MPTPTIIDLTEAIELLSYALECVAAVEPSDLTELTSAYLAGRIRENARQIREGKETGLTFEEHLGDV